MYVDYCPSHEALITVESHQVHESMDENSQSLSPFYSQPESPKIFIPKPASSGLTLVIPSLKSLKASQNANKPKQRAGSYPRSASVFQDVDNQEKKIQRPVKLKPLKEVLVKLIAQLKKLVNLFS
jgi:bromodomain-containing protein 7/9